MNMRVTKMLIVALAASSWSACGPRLAQRDEVPTEYRLQPRELIPPQNGEPERVRYRTAYEPFWWNCVIVKSRDLNARCPFVCSGTPAAAGGCADGGTDAENSIAALEKQYGPARAQAYLRVLVTKSKAHDKITPYFPDGPVAEEVPKFH